MCDKISSIINDVTSISNKSLGKINELIQYVNIKKGELITTVGEKNNREYFVIDGIVKTFLNTPEGESVTISFFMSNSTISPSTTRNQKGRSLLNIQALTDVEIGTIDAADFWLFIFHG